MAVREKLCGKPRDDGCGKPIGDAPYVVRYDEDLKQSIVYHDGCEAKLPPLEEWTTVPKVVAISKIASELADEALNEIVESTFSKLGSAIKGKHKGLLEKYAISDDEIKQAAKRLMRRTS